MTNSLIRLVALSGVIALGACTVQHDSPNLAGQDVHLTVVHTADLHSRFFPYYFAPGAIDKGLGLLPKPGQIFGVIGGLGRVSTIIKCIRGRISSAPEDAGIAPSVCSALEPLIGQPAARSLHIDSGDIFEGAPVFNQFQGEVEMRGMSALGVTAMALGNHEFDKGSVNLEEQYHAFGAFPMMAANYQFEDPTDYTQPKLGDMIRPFTMVNVGGLKVGIVGLGNLSSIQGIIQGGNSLGVRPLESTQAVAEAVSALRPNVDIVAVASHLGLDEDEGVAAGAAEAQDQNAAIAVNGVDIIFGGHLHIVLDPPKDLPHLDPTDGHVTGHTVLCHSGAFAKYVGRLDLVVHVADPLVPGDKTGVKSYTYRVIPIDDSIPSDPAMDRMLEPYLLRMNEALNLTQTYAVVPCPTTAGTCPKVQRTDPNGGDSQLGNLVAQSMRVRSDVAADYAVTNSLGIRDDFESGPLNLEEMYNVFPFDNMITTMFLSGDETQQMFDAVAARSAERGCRTQAQVAGIYFDLVCNQDGSDVDCNARLGPGQPCAKNITIGDNCRLPDGTLRNDATCKPIDQFGEYRVAVNDYIANGGSGFTVLQRNTTKFNTGISLRDALIDYIRTVPSRCTDSTMFTNIVGVTCKDKQNETFDCTSQCGGSAANLNTCQKQNMQPTSYDYRSITCLGQDVQAHDGRIQAYPDAQRKM
jgi:5'-nucleotidase/UDP-sugar diphosphatase